MSVPIDKRNPLIVIGASPDDLSDAALRACIESTRRRKTRERNHPAHAQEAKRVLELLPDYQKKLFSMPDERRRIETEFRAAIASARATINEQIKYLKEHGDYTKDNLRHLVSIADGRLGEAEIRTMLSRAGLKEQPKENTAEPEGPLETLDPTQFKDIVRHQRIAGVDSLYALLGARKNTSVEEIRKRHDDLYKQLHTSGKTDPVTTARQSLLGQAKVILTDRKKRDLYNNSLDLFVIDGFGSTIELAARNKMLTGLAMTRLVSDAVRRGASMAVAIAYIRRHCDARDIRVLEKAGAEQARELVVCGFCQTPPADPEQTNCANCGKSLSLPCPRCGQPVAASSAACRSCGQATGDYVILKSELDEAQRDLSALRFAAARARLLEARRFGEEWPEIGELEARIDAAEGPYRQGRSAAEDCLQQKRLVAARRFLSEQTLVPSPDFDFERLRAQAENGLRQAKAYLAKARECERRGDVDGALDQIDVARAIVVDLKEVEDVASRISPLTPGNADVEQLDCAMRITWTPRGRRRRQTSFLIIRKEGGAPRHAEDGEEVGRTTAHCIDDQSAPFGVPLHYAVYSDRGGVLSRKAAMKGPVLRVEAVKNVSVHPEDGGVRLDWRLPAGATGVRVWRRPDSPPEEPAEGTPVTGAGQAGLRDGTLRNGLTYGYLLKAVYPDPLRPGVELFGPPRTLTASPQAPLPPVMDLVASAEDGWLTLRWKPLSDASTAEDLDVAFHLVDARERLPPPGAHISVADLLTMGIEIARGRTGDIKTEMSPQGLFLVAPFTVRSSAAAIGKPCLINSMLPLENFRAQIQGRQVHLIWDWPKDVKFARVLWRSDHHEEDYASPEAARKDVSVGEYGLLGYTTITPNNDDDLYLTAFACTLDGGVSAPVKCFLTRCGEKRVFYAVKVSRRSLLSREKHVAVKIWSKQAVLLPELILVGRRGLTPNAPRDGDVIARFGTCSLSPDQPEFIEISTEYWDQEMHVKLFLIEPELYPGIRLMPYDAERVRLG